MEAKRGSAEAAPAKFTVTAVDQDGGGICYYLVPDGKAAANLWDVDHIHLPKSSGPHILQFALDDKTSAKKLSLRGTDPFDCADDHPCPPPGGINSSQTCPAGMRRCSGGSTPAALVAAAHNTISRLSHRFMRSA